MIGLTASGGAIAVARKPLTKSEHVASLDDLTFARLASKAIGRFHSVTMRHDGSCPRGCDTAKHHRFLHLYSMRSRRFADDHARLTGLEDYPPALNSTCLRWLKGDLYGYLKHAASRQLGPYLH